MTARQIFAIKLPPAMITSVKQAARDHDRSQTDFIRSLFELAIRGEWPKETITGGNDEQRAT